MSLVETSAYKNDSDYFLYHQRQFLRTYGCRMPTEDVSVENRKQLFIWQKLSFA